MSAIITNVGVAIDGDNVFRGHRVNAELVGYDGGLTSFFSLAFGGRRLTSEEAMFVEDVGVCSAAAADPRIWPLKLTQVVGSLGAVLPALACGRLSMEGAVMGAEPTGRAAATLVEWGASLGDDPSDEAIKTFLDALLAKGRAAGFGVAFRPRDERVDGLRACVSKRKRDGGRYWRLAMKLDALMQREKHVQINLAMASAAALLDVGFEPDQIGSWMCLYLDACFFANAVESAKRREPSLRRLPDDRIEYVGREARKSPRAT